MGFLFSGGDKTDYPFIYRGRTAGTLSVTGSGLFTVFELICRYTPEILRVSVYGGGKAFYLGIPQPQGKGLYLRRKLTRQEMLAVPEKIEYAACGEVHNRSERSDADKWTPHADGTLTSKDCIALPAALRSVPPGVVLKDINGRTYMLFRY